MQECYAPSSLDGVPYEGYMGGHTQRSNPLTICIPICIEKVPLFDTFYLINIPTYPRCIPKLQISVYEILTPYIPEAWKWYPFWAELPHIGHDGDLFSKHYQQLFPLQKCSFIVQLSNHSQSNYTATCFHPYHPLSFLANLFVSFIKGFLSSILVLVLYK